MMSSWTIRNRCAAVLAGLLLAAPARGDEKYLPNGTTVVFSLDAAQLQQSKAVAELKKQTPMIEKGLEFIGDNLGIAVKDMARVTTGTKGPGNDCTQIMTLKPVTAADIKARMKPIFAKNITYKEVKVGKYTIHQQSYQPAGFFSKDDKYDKTPTIEAMAFCVVEDKLVLHGKQSTLKEILERNQKPTLSAEMQAALAQTGFKNSITLVVDLPGLPARAQDEMKRDLGKQVPGLAENFDKLQTLAVKFNVGDTVKGSATLVCKDAASAAVLKKGAEAGIGEMKNVLSKDDPKMPAELKEVLKSARMFLDAIKLSTADNQVRAEVSVDAAVAARVFRGLIETGRSEEKTFKSVEPKVENKK